MEATDYFTKWLEEILVKNTTDTVVIKFIEENIFSRFGCPQQIVMDNYQAFNSIKMIELCQKYQITLHHSTPYYPQGNGLEGSSNESLIKVIKKVLAYHKRIWENMQYGKIEFPLKDLPTNPLFNLYMELKKFSLHS